MFVPQVGHIDKDEEVSFEHERATLELLYDMCTVALEKRRMLLRTLKPRRARSLGKKRRRRISRSQPASPRASALITLLKIERAILSQYVAKLDKILDRASGVRIKRVDRIQRSDPKK